MEYILRKLFLILVMLVNIVGVGVVVEVPGVVVEVSSVVVEVSDEVTALEIESF